jgi:uncharacterized protein YkwD
MATFGSVMIDVLLLIALGFGGFQGYKRGFLVSSANLVGLVISVSLAFFLYAPASQVFLYIWQIPLSLAHLLAFFVIAFLVDALVSWAIILASSAWMPIVTHRWYYVLGIVPGSLTAGLTIVYLASLFTALPLEHPLKTAIGQSALVYPLTRVVDRLGAPIDRLVAPAATDLSQLFTIEPDSKDFVQLNFTSEHPEMRSDLEDAMLVLVNKERSSRGIGVLTMDSALRSVARAHSLDMFQRGYFSHYTPDQKDPFDRMHAAGITYLTAGENLALAPSLPLAHTGLMNSPGHKRNILDPSYHRVGIGSYQDTRYGVMFSQEFTN